MLAVTCLLATTACFYCLFVSCCYDYYDHYDHYDYYDCCNYFCYYCKNHTAVIQKTTTKIKNTMLAGEQNSREHTLINFGVLNNRRYTLEQANSMILGR